MVILQVAHRVWPRSTGGVEIITWEVSQLCTEYLNAQVYVYSPKFKAKWDQGVWIEIDNSKSLQDVVNQIHPDIILVQHLLGVDKVDVETIEGLGIPYIVFLHDFWYLCQRINLFVQGHNCSGPGALKCTGCMILQNKLRDGLISKWWKNWLSFLSSAKGVITGSFIVRDIYQRNGLIRQDIWIIPGSFTVPLEKCRPTELTSDVMYLGGPQQGKGLKIFQDALSRLDSPLHIIIAGHGLDGGVVNRFPRQHSYEVMSRLSPQASRQKMCQSKVICCPSVWNETYGRVATEAVLLEVALVTTNRGPFLERFINYGNVRVVTPSGTAMASAIASLLKYSDRRISAVNPAKEFNLNLITRGIEDLLYLFDKIAHGYQTIIQKEYNVHSQEIKSRNRRITEILIGKNNIRETSDLAEWAKLWGIIEVND